MIRDLYGDDQPVADIVWIEDDGPINTGLVDRRGNPILRPRHKIPFGFHGRG